MFANDVHEPEEDEDDEEEEEDEEEDDEDEEEEDEKEEEEQAATASLAPSPAPPACSETGLVDLRWRSLFVRSWYDRGGILTAHVHMLNQDDRCSWGNSV